MRLPAIMLYAQFNDEDQSYKNDLDEQERLNRNKRIHRVTLKIYKYSSFKYVYLSGDNQAFVNATGHDRAFFNKLLHKCKAIYDTYMCDIETGLICRK